MKRLRIVGIASMIAGLTLLALTSGMAEAGGPGVAPWRGQMGQTGQFHQQRPHVTDTAPGQVTLPHPGFPGHPRPPINRPIYPYPGYPYVAYGYGLGCCAYSTPSYGTWVPGYWAYQWVAQQASSNAWVPGYYDPDGVWVAGYFSSQTVQGGYYQPYWVPGYWSP